MAETVIATDICVIGAGSAGLSVAAAAAQFGQKVVLIEKAEMGGDCLNTGCVPSKALIAAGKAAQTFRASAKFGIAKMEPIVDFARVNDHVHDVIAAIEPNDSQERFEKLGCRVIRAAARFIDEQTVEAGDERITARRFVIATGSRAAAPPIQGLDRTPYFTNETIFANTELPAHLLIIGGGPIGLEMAQAHRRLGSQVTVIEALKPLAKDDPELTAVVLSALEAEGIEILAETAVISAAKSERGVVLEVSMGGETRRIAGSHLLVATGRTPNIEDLGLETAGIEYTKRGVKIDDSLRTTNRKVYAIGDVAGGLQFTHVAGYHAGLVIKNALFRLPVKASAAPIPWVTFTDPELAHVGLTEAEARKQHGDAVQVLTWPVHENDRAQADRRTEGLIKILAGRGGRILGAGIVAANAGELLAPWSLAITNRLKLKSFVDTVFAYPTYGEIGKRVAIKSYAGLATKPLVRNVIGILSRFG